MFNTTNITNITKGLIVVSSIIVSLLGAKNVYAAEGCKPPQTFVDGVQEYDGPSTNGILVARGPGRKLRVRFNSLSYSDGRVTCNMGDKPGFKKTEKGALIDKDKSQVLRTPYVEFEGEVGGKVGETVVITFLDISGNSYSVTIKIKDAYAEQGAVDSLESRKADKSEVDKKADKSEVDKKADKEEVNKKADKDSVYTKEEVDSLLGGEGRFEGEIGSGVNWRPNYEAGPFVEGTLAWRFAHPQKVSGRLKLRGGWTQNDFPTRAVSGVPHTETKVPWTRTWFGITGQGDFPVGDYVNFSIGGGLMFAWDSYPGTTVGQDPVTGTAWGVHPSSNMFTVVLAADAGVRFYMTGNRRRGLFFEASILPGVELGPTKVIAGSDDKSNKFVLQGGGALGFSL